MRRKLPTTSTRSSALKSAMGIPSQGMPARLPASRKSIWRSRKSTWSLPSVRIKRAANASSSSVECGDTSAPTAPAPCFATTSDRPFATYSSAVCQSTVFHSPPRLSIGDERRSSELSASYEKRSLSESQHSLIASFSNGSTRITRSALTCTIRLLPSASCGDTLRRRVSSHGRAVKRNGREVSAPTGQRSIELPDSSESMVRPMNETISACSPRPIMPSSMTPAISWPKRTQRVHWIQRVISSAATSGPRCLRNTTRFASW